MSEAAPDDATGLEDYLGKQVAIDTDSQLVIVGTLVRVDRHYLTLEDVDVHDTCDSSSTKDHYIMEAHKYGLRSNRGGAKVRIARVVSLSLVSDVTTW